MDNQSDDAKSSKVKSEEEDVEAEKKSRQMELSNARVKKFVQIKVKKIRYSGITILQREIKGQGEFKHMLRGRVQVLMLLSRTLMIND